MEESKYTTILLDAEMKAHADAIARALGPMTRTAAVRRALADLFLRVCPTDKPIDISVVEQVSE